MTVWKRSFRYYAKVEELRRYIEASGYRTEEAYQRDGRPYGFIVCDTTIQVDYDIVVEGRTVGYGGVSLRNGPAIFDGDTGKAERSFKLYLKLYRRYRKPHPE